MKLIKYILFFVFIFNTFCYAQGFEIKGIHLGCGSYEKGTEVSCSDSCDNDRDGDIDGSDSDCGTNVVFDDGDGVESPWSPTSNAGNWDSYTGTPVLETIIVKKGSQSLEGQASGQYMVKDISDQTEIWADGWVYFDTRNVFSVLVEFTDGVDYLDFCVHGTSDDFRFYDDVSNWNAGVALGEDTWYHWFIHIKHVGDGSDVLQIAVSETDYWDAWDLNNSTASLVSDNATDIKWGHVYQGSSETYYHDAVRFFNGTSMPTEWSP